MTHQPFAIVLFTLIFSSCVGCGDGTRPVELALVTGKVTRDGTPLGGARVDFFPELKGCAASSSTTNADGEFRLSYTDGRKGATLGVHRVKVCLEMIPTDNGSGKREPLAAPPEEFAWPDPVTVKKDENKFTFDLK